ncbi:MAG: sulfotransferase family 2 domain-containing protein [Sphingomonadaceae bacterium]
MPVPKLPLRLLGLSDIYHLLWWQRTIARRSVLTPWNETHQAIFVHIPKTAGTSVLAALGAPPVFDTHAPARAYARAYPEFYARAYKFAFVRNPWDRFASSFHFMKHGTDWPMQQEWAARHIGDLDFAAFTHRLRNPLFRATVLSERFFWPQTIWLGGLGSAAGVDALFRFEAVDAATRELCDRFGIPAPATVPHLRKVEKGDFRDLYDGPMIDIVGRLYRHDVTALGYAFAG